MEDIFDSLNSTLYFFNPTGGVVWSIAFEPLPSIMTSYANKRGGNVLGLSEGGGNGFSQCISDAKPTTCVLIYFFSHPCLGVMAYLSI